MDLEFQYFNIKMLFYIHKKWLNAQASYWDLVFSIMSCNKLINDQVNGLMNSWNSSYIERSCLFQREICHLSRIILGKFLTAFSHVHFHL